MAEPSLIFRTIARPLEFHFDLQQSPQRRTFRKDRPSAGDGLCGTLLVALREAAGKTPCLTGASKWGLAQIPCLFALGVNEVFSPRVWAGEFPDLVFAVFPSGSPLEMGHGEAPKLSTKTNKGNGKGCVLDFVQGNVDSNQVCGSISFF